MSIDLQGKRVALVGGAGFIGHNLALMLKSQGAEVAIIDGLHVNSLLSLQCSNNPNANARLYTRFIDQRIELLREADIPLFVQDAREYHALCRQLNETAPDVVVHLAAVAHANRSNKDPFSTFDHSLRTLENALDWSRSQAKHFVYLSSSMVYGNFLTPQVDEEHPLDPMGIYGALKLSGEKLVTAYQQVFELPYTIIRPSALYGPRCVSRRVGQIFIENALDGKPLRVDGDGLEKLDFTYIDDFAQGVMRVIARPAAINQTFNLTYGSSRSIADLAEIVQREFPGIGVEYVPRDRLMPFRGTLSVDKARELLGYKPQFPIDRGFIDYINWYKAFYQRMNTEDDGRSEGTRIEHARAA